MDTKERHIIVLTEMDGDHAKETSLHGVNENLFESLHEHLRHGYTFSLRTEEEFCGDNNAKTITYTIYVDKYFFVEYLNDNFDVAL